MDEADRAQQYLERELKHRGPPSAPIYCPCGKRIEPHRIGYALCEACRDERMEKEGPE